MGKLGKNQSTIRVITMGLIIFYFITLSNNVGALVTRGNPFWLPLEFDIGTGYFKTNVSILGLKDDTGLIKVCVTPEAIRHKLCHYMNAQEEGQVIAPNITVHAGIYVFPSSYIPIGSNLDICITILGEQKAVCKVINNTSKEIEERVYITLEK